MAVSIITSHGQQCDSNGVPLNAGTIDVYAAGTTTPLSLYSNEGLSVAATNPITLDSSGRHAMTYIATASYKLVLKNSAGTTIYTHDNIDPGVAVGSGALPVANGGTAATTAAAARTNLAAASSADMATAQSDISNLLTWVGYLLTTITRVAFGTTAQEPAAASAGFRYDTTTGFLRFCNTAAWFNLPRSGQVVIADFAASAGSFIRKRSRTTSTTTQTIGASIPMDASVPLISEGTALTDFTSVSFTPLSASTAVRVEITIPFSFAAGSTAVFALFKDGATNAVSSVVYLGDGGALNHGLAKLTYEFSPGATTAIVFQLRGGTTGTLYICTDNAGAVLGSTRIAEMLIEEIQSP